jgi:hypothetical protein
MRGGYVHNNVLIGPVEEHFRRLGATVRREYPVRLAGGSPSFVDLFVELGGHRVACEAELTSRRVAGDFAKAAALKATWLLIVTPTGKVAEMSRRQVQRLRLRLPGGRVSILPLGPALQQARDCFLLISNPIRPQTTNQKGRA